MCPRIEIIVLETDCSHIVPEYNFLDARGLGAYEGKKLDSIFKVIVDNSSEVGGDGDIPHFAIGGSRRLQVPKPSIQHIVMIEAVKNHMPKMIIVDEIGGIV